MSGPSPSALTKMQPVTLDEVLLAQYRLPLTPCERDQSANPSEKARVLFWVGLGAALTLLLLASCKVYTLSVGPILLLSVLGNLIEAGLYVIGFILAFVYEQGLNPKISKVGWKALGLGVIYFGLAYRLLQCCRSPATGFFAILLFLSVGFITSPGLKNTRGEVMSMAGKLLQIFSSKTGKD